MRSVHAETIIRCSPGKAFLSFLQQPRLEQWWGVSRSMVEPWPGGVWTLAWEISDAGIRYISSGIIDEIVQDDFLKISRMVYLNPDRQILGPMALDIQFSQKDEWHTHVNLIQSGYQHGGDWDWYYEAVVQAWPYALNLLKQYLENDEKNG